MEPLDDDEGELFEAFHALRVHIVQVSSAFGARLGVRLRALSAAERQNDPSVVEVFGATVVEALTLMSSPLVPSRDARDTPDELDAPDTAADAREDAPADERDSDDE